MTLVYVLGFVYLAASLACFAGYARDKAAAQGRLGRRARRTPERTLLLLGLAGGWPGGLLAQRWLRHKTAKRPFQRLFRASVAANLALNLACLAVWAEGGIHVALS
jgi:uncharacterized membrane protein YsdA (DUF1294 family)